MKKIRYAVALVGAVLVSSASLAEFAVRNGESVAFLGDSITQFGDWPAGYVNMVIRGFEVNGLSVKKIPAGISGHKSNDMLARVQADVIDKKPTWMTLSCGVNDVWHADWGKGVSLEDYKKNITALLDRVTAAGIRPVILTATMVQENEADPKNAKLAPYNDFLRAEAKRRGCPLADLNRLMRERLAEIRKTDATPGNKLTRDGVHMAFAGNMMMAEGVLRAFGADDAAIAKAKAAWLDMPGCEEVRVSYSYNEWKAFEAKAKAAGKDPSDYLKALSVR